MDILPLLIVLISLCGMTIGVSRIDPLVSTKVGLIRGLRDDRGYSKFLGIPYGQLNGSAFGAGIPHPAFEEIFEAYDGSKVCPQVDKIKGPIGTIDCLNLDIYVPDAANSKNPLPVMVWIHGGAFNEGSAYATVADEYSLIRHDVILVAINYRLGVFGFMCLDIPEVPGNTGLKDQVLALRWINENIEAFGGNKNQITVFGESAGGMSINLHLLSPYEKLFNKAVIQSGPANSPWVIVKSDRTLPIRIARALGFNTTDVFEALSFMKSANSNKLVLVSDYFTNNSHEGRIMLPLAMPCVEKEFEGVENFIIDHPVNIEPTKVNKIPVMIGYNGLELVEFLKIIDTKNAFNHNFAMAFEMNDEITEAIEIAKQFYIGDEEVNDDVIKEIVDFGSDFVFNYPSQKTAQSFVDNGAESVYSYIFSYNGDESLNKTWPRASHGDEITYLFNQSIRGEVMTQQDYHVVDVMTELWTNFAKYSDPTPTTSDLLPVKWSPITATTFPYLEIDTELTLKSRPFNSRMAFWDIFYKHYGKHQKGYKGKDGDI